MWDPDPKTVSCSDETFIAKVVEVSEDSPYENKILKIYGDATVVSRSDELLECRGTAMTARDGEKTIRYYIEVDRDGDSFIGFSF